MCIESEFMRSVCAGCQGIEPRLRGLEARPVTMTLQPRAWAAPRTGIEPVSFHRQWDCDASRITRQWVSKRDVSGRTRACVERCKTLMPVSLAGDVRPAWPGMLSCPELLRQREKAVNYWFLLIVGMPMSSDCYATNAVGIEPS